MLLVVMSQEGLGIANLGSTLRKQLVYLRLLLNNRLKPVE